MAAINKLHHSGIRGNILWQTYIALVFSQKSYCSSVLCDIPQHFLIKLCKIERWASKLSDRQYNPKELLVRLDNICLKLMYKVRTDTDHPIRKCFMERKEHQRKLRNSIPIMPMNRTNKLLKFLRNVTIVLILYIYFTSYCYYYSRSTTNVHSQSKTTCSQYKELSTNLF